MSHLNFIHGAGGKPGPAGGKEEPDNLQSRAYLRVLDLICEGEIAGFPSGNTGTLPLHNVYLDEIPILNPNGSSNFNISGLTTSIYASGVSGNNFTLGFSLGTLDQQPIEGFDIPYAFVPLPTNKEVKKFDGDRAGDYKDVILSLNSNLFPDAKSIRINLRTNSLMMTKKNGDIVSYSISYQIDISLNGAEFQTVHSGLMSGKASSGYARSIDIPLPVSESSYNDWKIRVRRVSQNTNTLKTQDDLFVESAHVIFGNKYSYPGTAVGALEFDAEIFGNVPQRSYELKLLKIKVPSNYNPETRTYSGIWDGTFSTEKKWTDNPAWIFYDILTNEKYGIGQYIREDWVDKWTLYEIAQYCDELVDGEPRFTCNVLFTQKEDAYKVIQNLASVFRGMVYWGAGRIFTVQDKDKDPFYLFSNANVIDGEFQYSSTSYATRKTVALVKWVDPDDFYRESIEYIEDPDGIVKYGYIETEVTAFACTSRSQARRLGEWILKTEQLLTESVVFRTSIEGYSVRPGDLIQIADNFKLNTSVGGRIAQVYHNSGIRIDRNINLIQSKNYYLSIVSPKEILDIVSITGSNEVSGLRKSQVEKRQVFVPYDTGTDVLFTTSGFSETPLRESVWILESVDINPSLSTGLPIYKILAASEVEPSIVEILAIDHSKTKFTYVDNPDLTSGDFAFYTGDNSPIDAPTGFFIERDTGILDCDFFDWISLSWSGLSNTSNLSSYRLSGQVDGGPLFSIATTTSNSYNYVPNSTGFHVFYLRSISKGGVFSPITSGSYTLSGTNILGGPPTLLNNSIYLDSGIKDNTNTGYYGNSPIITWSLNTGEDGCPIETRAIYLQKFKVNLLDISSDAVITGWDVDENTFSYQFSYAQLTGAYPSNPRASKASVEVWDIYDNKITGATLLFGNSAPQAPAATSFYANVSQLNYAVTKNTGDRDANMLYLWINDSVITPSFSSPTLASENFAGTIAHSYGTAFNYWYSIVDTFGTTGCPIYGPFSITPNVGVTGLRANTSPYLQNGITFSGVSGIRTSQSGQNIIFSALLSGSGNTSISYINDRIVITSTGVISGTSGVSSSLDIRDVWLLI